MRMKNMRSSRKREVGKKDKRALKQQGVVYAANVLRQVNNIGIAYFTREDSVRGAGLTRDILEAYDRCGN